MALRWAWPLLALLAAGCGQSSATKGLDRPVPSDQITDFMTLYKTNCSGCHGADGKLGPAPPLNDPTFLAIVPDEVLMMLVAEGRPGTPMPAFGRSRGGPLTDDQVKIVAQGIKPRWRASEKSAERIPHYDVTAKSPGGDKARGRQLFARACAKCHGAEGEGKKDGAGAIRDPVFLALISDQCLRRYVITGRPDLGMPHFAGKKGRPDDFKPLDEIDVTDLVALLRSWKRDGQLASAGGPAGAPQDRDRRRTP